MSVYAVSDMHGCADVYHRIKKIVKPEDTVYCLGDCGDRGKQPWETIKLVATDPQFIYIKGNHEDMLIKAVREVLNEDGWDCHDQRLLASNGGMKTLEGIMSEDNPAMWMAHLILLPCYATYTNTQGQKIFMCHAGCSLWADEPENIPDDHDLIWDRTHYISTKSDLMSDTIVVHGHTPIAFLAEDIGVEEPDEWVPLTYCDGKKICIDQGTVWSGHSILLNLDTLESIDINLYKERE